MIFCSCARRVGVIPSPSPWQRLVTQCLVSPGGKTKETQDPGQEPVELKGRPGCGETMSAMCFIHYKDGPEVAGIYHLHRVRGTGQMSEWTWILLSPFFPGPRHRTGPSAGTSFPFAFPWLTTAETRCWRNWLSSRQQWFKWQIHTVCGSNQSQRNASLTWSPDAFKAWAELSMNCKRNQGRTAKTETHPAWHGQDWKILDIPSNWSWIFDQQWGGTPAFVALHVALHFSHVTLLPSEFRGHVSSKSCKVHNPTEEKLYVLSTLLQLISESSATFSHPTLGECLLSTSPTSDISKKGKKETSTAYPLCFCNGAA